MLKETYSLKISSLTATHPLYINFGSKLQAILPSEPDTFCVTETAGTLEGTTSPPKH